MHVYMSWSFMLSRTVAQPAIAALQCCELYLHNDNNYLLNTLARAGAGHLDAWWQSLKGLPPVMCLAMACCAICWYTCVADILILSVSMTSVVGAYQC